MEGRASKYAAQLLWTLHMQIKGITSANTCLMNVYSDFGPDASSVPAPKLGALAALNMSRPLMSYTHCEPAPLVIWERLRYDTTAPGWKNDRAISVGLVVMVVLELELVVVGRLGLVVPVVVVVVVELVRLGLGLLVLELLELGLGLLVPVGLVVLVTMQLDTPKQIPLRSRLVGHEFWPWTMIVQAVAAVTEPEGQPLTVPRKGPIAPNVKSRAH